MAALLGLRHGTTNGLSDWSRLLKAMLLVSLQLPAIAYAQDSSKSVCLDVLLHAGKNIKTFDFHHNAAAAAFREMCSSDEGYVHRAFDKEICSKTDAELKGSASFPIKNIPISFGVGSKNARDYCRSDETLDLQRWRNDKCSADMGQRSVDFQSHMVEEIADEGAIKAWRDCVTAQFSANTQGLSCFLANPGEHPVLRVISRPDLHDGIKVTLLEVQNGSLLSPKPELLSEGTHDFPLKRAQRTQSAVFVLSGQVSATATRTFSCNLEIPPAPCLKPQYREKSDEKCGIDKVLSGRGPACGVEAYKMDRTPGCGVDRYRAKRAPGCGVEQYQRCIHSDCGRHPWPHNGRKKCRTARCGVESYKSCRLEAFGIERYKACRNADHGVEQYRECEHREFGVEFKSCRLPAFGLEACLDGP